MNKLKLIISGIILVIIITLITGWKITSNNLKQTKQLLSTANTTIINLTTENKKLNEYNQKRDIEIKKLEKEYAERINNIPKDNCGDSKPSDELLKFFKSGRI